MLMRHAASVKFKGVFLEAVFGSKQRCRTSSGWILARGVGL
jgi:hypothetical protein